MPDQLDFSTAPTGADPVPLPGVGQPVVAASAETVRLYAADWLDFSAWCRMNRCRALPASGETLSAYLLAVAPRLSRGALGRRRAAIGRMHREHQHAVPRLDAPARAALRRTARRPATSGTAQSQDAAMLTRAALRCPRDLAGLRDRALLLLAAATASPGRGGRRSGQTTTKQALLALTREQIRFVEAGLTLQLGDRPGGPASEPPLLVAWAMAAASCPVRAMEAWLRASDTRFGPVFRKVDRWGNVEHAGLASDGLRRIVARRAEPLQRCPR